VNVFDASALLAFRGAYGAGAASLLSPWGVALNAAGGLVIADTDNDRIRMVG
jgi:hypothetical protein